MKKIITTILATILCLGVFASCGKEKLEDYAYLEDKGEITIGITLFNPMNFNDENGKLTGFETEFATAVCEKLGLTPNFQVIEWDSKETELKSFAIDCIWNGMTIKPELQENLDISIPYMENKQVLVTSAENADTYATKEGLAGKSVVAESGSAGETTVTTNDFFADVEFVGVDSQATTLLEVKSKTADAAVIDYVMTIGSIGEGTDYSDLVMVEGTGFGKEEYGVAFRKNSPETLEKFNNAMRELAEDGTLDEIATKYKLQDLIIVK